MQQSMRPFKAFYFFIYVALAFLAPFLTLYYERLGLDGKQIGILAALPSVITFISAPIFGALADVTQKHKRILGVSILLVVVGVLIISRVKTFLSLIPGVFIYAFFFAPALPIIDRSVLEILGSKRDQYGKYRLWGAIGWGTMAPFAGMIVEKQGLNWAFYGSAVFFMVLFLISQQAPILTVNLRAGFWSNLGKLFSSWRVIVFFVAILMSGMGLAMIHHYLFLYLDYLGANAVAMGLALTIATISELFIMYFSDRLLKRWKPRGLILFGLVMISIRLFGYAFASTPGLALGLQLLHGPTFASIWMAGVAYVAEITPPGLGNTAQGMFNGVMMGLGSALGGFLGGFLFQAIGFSQMFAFTGAAVFIGFLLFGLGCRQNCSTEIV
ncbi:hypothetical protein AMJ86_01885 [bacterium SM23_57]|jgi:PPP family 3-phenylpropionic acid transporter|nr:MAG: hypothetical protein AMJ86_01885 [bacterium SM23_57]